MTLNQKKEEKGFEDNLPKPPKKTISNYLPRSLLKDLSYDEDDSNDEEIFEVISPINKRKAVAKSNFKRRRSSSLDLGIYSNIPHKVNHVQFAEIEKANEVIYTSYNNHTKNNINCHNNNNNITLFTQENAINSPYLITNLINPSSSNSMNQQIKPRTKHSENISERKKNSSPFTSNEEIIHPVKKYSNNFIKRDFSQNIFNTNQTFKEFLSNNSEKLSSIMRSSTGSRFLQKMIDQITTSDLNDILNILNAEHNIITTICDNYGNYFMKKIIQKCNHEQRMFLYDKLKSKFITIANDISGTHCLQSLIESIEMKDEEKSLKQCVFNHLLDLSFSSNATHVIQKIISVLKEPNRQYINSFVLSHFLILCKNVNGICVIKTFISFNIDEQIKIIVLSNLEKNCFDITQDLYGNYVIQHALEYYGYYHCINIITMICSNIILFSNQKFASNVVDRVILILQKSNYSFFKQVIASLFLNQINFVELLRNKFGLFVLINSLKLLSIEDKVIIKAFLIQNIMINDNEDKNKFYKVLGHCK